MAPARADGHGVMGRAGDGAGGQVNAELVFGVAVGVAHRGHFGAHVVAVRRLLIQGGPVGVGPISVHLKVFRLAVTPRVATAVLAGVGGLTGSGFGVGGRWPVSGWSNSSSMTSRSAVLAAGTATLMISSSSGSTPKCDL